MCKDTGDTVRDTRHGERNGVPGSYNHHPTVTTVVNDNDSNKNNKDIAPVPQGGGFQRTWPLFTAFMGLLFAVYGGFYFAFADADTIWGLTPADAVCHSSSSQQQRQHEKEDGDGVCRRADLFAFQMASVVYMYTAGLMGLYHWYFTRQPHRLLPATPQGRLLGYLPSSERLSTVALAYQTFDFLVSLTIPEHCTPIMMTHHFLAAAVAYCSIRYQFLHYYGYFFLGLSEVSTFFLVWMDLANYFPAPDGSTFAMLLETVAGPGFVVTFIGYRVLQWWPVSLQLFRDARAVVSSGTLDLLRPGQSWVLYVFLLSNLPLGLLQLYWLTIILGEVQETLSGEA